MSLRPQDQRPYDRSESTLVQRIGTVSAVGASKLDVTVPGGVVLPGVPQLAGFTATVGARVALLIGGDSALVIGLIK